jgi:hypothetical protein
MVKFIFDHLQLVQLIGIMKMVAMGIRILDEIGGVISVNLPDILQEIGHGNSFYWSILYLYSMGHLGEGQSIPVFEEKILNSEKGLLISWEDLNSLSKKFYQIFDITLIGCRDIDLIKRYQNDEEMYNACDIAIEMIDSGCWEVFSKDRHLIYKLVNKFKEIEFLEPNFEK